MCAVAWKFSGEDYIMRSICERVHMSITFVPASGKSSGVCTHEDCTHFRINFLMKLNINCIHNELMNIISVCSYWSLNWLSYWKITRVRLCAVTHSLLFGVLLFIMENGSFIGDWISINLFAFGLSVDWKPVRNYASC